MKKIIFSSVCLTLLAAIPSASALPLSEIVVQTSNGRVEINNGRVIIDNTKIDRIPHTTVPYSSNSVETYNNHSNSNLNSIYSFSSSQSVTNAISLSSTQLNSPHLVKLKANSNLSGQISLNGRVLKKITGNNFSLDLAPYLSRGEHQIQIEVNPSTSNATVSMALIAPGATINHTQSGRLQQTIIVNVGG